MAERDTPSWWSSCGIASWGWWWTPFGYAEHQRNGYPGPPEFGTKVDVGFLNGLAKSGDKLVALLNIDRLLRENEVQKAVTGAA